MADHDLDAERAVLGAVLLEPSRFDEAASVLATQDYYRLAHSHVWRTMVRLHEAGTGIDYKSVADALQADKLLDEVQPIYLAGLVDGVPRSSNISYYARKVHDLAERRSLLRVIAATAKAVEADGVTPDAVGPLKAVLDLQVGGSVSDTAVHQQAVIVEVNRERARRDARRRLDAEERGAHPIPDFQTLGERLARPRPPKRERIAGWQPWGSNVMLSAQFKAGKTTLRDNLVRSLVDGDAFLGRAQVTPITGTVVVLDLELPEDMLDAWLAGQQIAARDRVVVVALKGKVGSFNILDPVCRREWAARLKSHDAEYLILDCLRPIFDAFGLDEKSDAGKILGPFDSLKFEANILDAAVVHHMGHSGERARGDSRLRDWPDAEWRLTRESDDPRSTRYITAFGRDVDILESRLDFDPTSRRLWLAGGSRRHAADAAALVAVVEVLRDAPAPMTGRQITEALADTDHKRDAVTTALKDGRQTHALHFKHGPNRSFLYSLRPGVPVSGGVRPVSGSTPDFRCTGVTGAYKAPDTGHRTEGRHERI